MLQSILFGGGYAFAAAIQPGPLQAFLLSRVAANGWKRTLPASFSPVISDIPVALMVLLVLGNLPTTMQWGLRCAGGFLLLYLAFSALRQSRAATAGEENLKSGPRTLVEAVLVNVVNPNAYIGWALVLGPAVVSAWRQHPANAAALIIAFYSMMIVTLAAFILLVGTARFLGPRMQRGLVITSAVALALIGVYQLVVSVPRLVSAI